MSNGQWNYVLVRVEATGRRTISCYDKISDLREQALYNQKHADENGLHERYEGVKLGPDGGIVMQTMSRYWGK